MKKFRKLLPALSMLLISALLMGSSTFAWFSMNTTVTATGMSVKANTDNAYLIISAGTTLSGSSHEANANQQNISLKPVKPMNALTADSIETLGSWGVAQSTDPNDANKDADLTALTEGTLLGNGNYVLKQSFMVGIVAYSGTVANDLKLKTLTISDLNDGVTVVVVCGNNIFSHNTNVTEGTEILADKSAVSTTGIEVKVYIYIDGSNENVKTANAANLSAEISMTFTIDK